MNSIALFIPEMLDVKKQHKPVRVAGIDLGTTNSTISEISWSPESSALLKTCCHEIAQKLPGGGNGYKSTIVPSVVSILNDEIYIGEGAKRLRATSAAHGLYQNKNLFYECKNDIGIRKTYAKAPDGFRTAAEIGGKILEFLHRSALRDQQMHIDRTVITVPSSFQSAQRRDTLHAAELAGLDLKAVELLDEPVAAFLDYLMHHRDVLSKDAGQPKNLLVFDFGGGTCDVSIFTFSMPETGYPVKVFPLAASRYHRLGGGDIDRAIVHELLIPKILSVNSLNRFDLGYEDKREYLEPMLLGMAEELKIQLCDEITRLRQKVPYDDKVRKNSTSVIPGIFTFNVRGFKLVLNCPELSAEDFDKLLEPFLDKDLLYARETEYRMVCSVLAPLQDALDRSRLEQQGIDYCLMLGGSCLIPQVADAIKKFFPNASMLTFPDREALQTSVARGAAFHALTLQLFGKGIVQQVCYDAIALRTESGTVELVPRGTELPYPSREAYKRIHVLAVPQTSLDNSLELKVELVAGDEKRSLYRALWNIPGPVNKGDPLCVEYRYDENQVLDLNILLEDTRESFSATIENPLTNVVNPRKAMLKILELEENIRAGVVTGEDVPRTMIEIGTNYSELGYKEKAVHVLKQALKTKGGPDAEILNTLGLYYMDMGDCERAEKFYREAGSVSSWTAPLFNLALSQRRRRQYDKAAETIDRALLKNMQAPYLVFKALLASDTGNQAEYKNYLQESFKVFAPVANLSDWELGWYLTAAERAAESDRIAAAKAEQQKRLNQDEHNSYTEAVLPIIRQSLVKAQ